MVPERECCMMEAKTLQEVTGHVSKSASELYLKARDAVREKKQAEEHAREMERLEERLRKELNDQMTPVRRLILEKVLTTSCPRCQAAFLDFDGCMALTCGSPGCGTGFCALCLQDCGADAHEHVRGCKYNTVAPGHVFVHEDQFPGMQKAWRISKIREVR